VVRSVFLPAMNAIRYPAVIASEVVAMLSLLHQFSALAELEFLSLCVVPIQLLQVLSA